MEIAKTSDDHKRYYADVVAAGGLSPALNEKLAAIDSPLRAPSGPPSTGFEMGPSYARIEHKRRSSQTYMAVAERQFLPDFWLRGVCMAHFRTSSLEELALVIHIWNFEEVRVTEMQTRFPSLRLYRANASAFEDGSEIESEWQQYRDTNKGTEIAPIIELASRHALLGQLFPYRSLGRLGFSRTTGFPYTFDLPLITTRNSAFLVTDYEGTKVLGETRSAEEAIALVASLLPAHCQRAISGTCEDLPETDPWHQTDLKLIK